MTEYAIDKMGKNCTRRILSWLRQQMVVFVAGLTINSASSMFLASHTSERYLKYKQQLLTGTRKAELLSAH